ATTYSSLPKHYVTITIPLGLTTNAWSAPGPLCSGHLMVEGHMSEKDVVWQERRLEEILFSNTDPVSKVQQIIRLGFDPEVADAIVERNQIGEQAPLYYERLDFADLDEDIPSEEVASSSEEAPTEKPVENQDKVQ